MSEELWKTVDRYLTDNLVPPDPVLDEALLANTLAGLPSIDVAPTQGKLLYLLAKIQGAKRILEIGTLGGYSTIWMARALPPDGKLITLEINSKHAEVAAGNIERARLASKVEIRIGPALESLAQLQAEGTAAFDLIFLDADKPNNATYLEWALRFSRPGTVIIGDNVIREGAVSDPSNPDPMVQGARRFIQALASEPRLEATAIQTVGSKGYDGYAVAVVKG